MGTRSLTKVIQTWEDDSGKKQRKPITCMYRQYDGYLDGHGQDLAKWLSGYTIVNGIPVEHKTIDNPQLMFNGLDCLAAQMFAHFKDGAGGIYCMHPDAKDCWEEYLYEISEDENKQILLTVYMLHNDNKEVFHGTPKELLTEIKEHVEH
jgi:hypothetical protein